MPAPREPETIPPPPALTEFQLKLKQWAANGAALGFILGALVVVLVIGPAIRELGAVQLVAYVAGGAVVGAVLGYCAIHLATGGQAAPPSLGLGGGEGGDGEGSGDGQ